MGFRFRKSIKAGPMRVNLSKSGIGYSIGTKGVRYTQKAGGGTRTTVSVPGTGLSYVTDSSSKHSSPKRTAADQAAPELSAAAASTSYGSNEIICPICHKANPAGTDRCANCWQPLEDADDSGNKPKGCMGCLTVFALVILAVMLLSLLLSQRNSSEPETIASVPTVPTTQATEPATTQASAITPIDVSGLLGSASSSQKTYILNTSAMKFHLAGCSSVDDMSDANKKTFKGTRAEVIDMGYSPCGRCNP